MVTVDMLKVKSSNLMEIGYSEKDAKLFVRFIGGKLYVYDPVPPIVWMGLRECQSKGRYLATQVIPFFRCRRLADAELNSKVRVQ
jgi:hypothetical protein